MVPVCTKCRAQNGDFELRGKKLSQRSDGSYYCPSCWQRYKCEECDNIAVDCDNRRWSSDLYRYRCSSSQKLCSDHLLDVGEKKVCHSCAHHFVITCCDECSFPMWSIKTCWKCHKRLCDSCSQYTRLDTSTATLKKALNINGPSTMEASYINICASCITEGEINLQREYARAVRGWDV